MAHDFVERNRISALSDHEIANVDRLYREVNELFVDEPASHCVYCIGMLIARAIDKTCVSMDPGVTFAILRDVVTVELNKSVTQ